MAAFKLYSGEPVAKSAVSVAKAEQHTEAALAALAGLRANWPVFRDTVVREMLVKRVDKFGDVVDFRVGKSIYATRGAAIDDIVHWARELFVQTGVGIIKSANEIRKAAGLKSISDEEAPETAAEEWNAQQRRANWPDASSRTNGTVSALDGDLRGGGSGMLDGKKLANGRQRFMQRKFRGSGRLDGRRLDG